MSIEIYTRSGEIIGEGVYSVEVLSHLPLPPKLMDARPDRDLPNFSKSQNVPNNRPFGNPKSPNHALYIQKH